MEYLTRNELIERGWTQNLIKKLLGSPDSYRNGDVPGKPHRPFHLFSLDRIEKLEKSEVFANHLRRARVTSERVAEQVEKKAAHLKKIIDSANFMPLTLSLETVLSDVGHSEKNDPAVLHQLALEVFLDNLESDEDETIARFAWNSGIRMARLHFIERKLNHIVKLFPDLQDAVNLKLDDLEKEKGALRRT